MLKGMVKSPALRNVGKTSRHQNTGDMIGGVYDQ
ncbi:hypothetical protein F442_20834 [Phytophthora nicotianae P10297]|uniref:Uncharacterized protein n=2 Tax=Phytophthora nicotianae TaxID=4792 RepID=W2PGN8_PHYN3|nr:hypothetical protein PPTG_24324 [Phytophthora nicotianae INRA-310]ETN00052.1 hypothetical protein PPTG_24324 [Phytophthora nicotianae INRA-310]ETP30118.1 hypothetical protein F442_20834 [Phytophthora nicotianae P10297]